MFLSYGAIFTIISTQFILLIISVIYIRVTKKLSNTLEKSHSTACQNIERINQEISAGKEALVKLKHEFNELAFFKEDIIGQIEELKTSSKINEINIDTIEQKQKEIEDKFNGHQTTTPTLPEKNTNKRPLSTLNQRLFLDNKKLEDKNKALKKVTFKSDKTKLQTDSVRTLKRTDANVESSFSAPVASYRSKRMGLTKK